MSIQHKSRIKTVADYSENISFKGACCYPHNSTPVEEYYNTCISNKGIWYPMEEGRDTSSFACPDVGATGCCCACKYVDNFRGTTGFFQNWGDNSDNCRNYENTTGYEYPCYQGGLKDNVTFCECADAGGVWAEGVSCSIYTGATCDNWENDICVGINYIPIGAQSLCTRNFSEPDVRFPGSCCSPLGDDAGSVCDDACNIKHCAEFRDSYGSIENMFDNSSYCQLPAGNNYPNYGILSDCETRVANATSNNPFSDNPMYEQDLRTKVYIPKYSTPIPSFNDYTSNSNVSSACVYIQRNDSGSTEMICASLTKSECNAKEGMFVGFDDENQPFSCDSDASTEIKTYIQNKRKIDSATLSTWSLGERRLNLPGRFIGEMYLQDSNHGSGSRCSGNPNTGRSNTYYPVDNDNTENSGKSFAVFVADNDFQYRSFNENGWAYDTNRNKENAKDSSSWDSEFNTSHNRHFSLIKKIDKSYNKNPYHDFHIPSKDVLAFIKNQIYDGRFIENTTTKDKYPNSPYKPMKVTNKDFYWSSTHYKSEPNRGGDGDDDIVCVDAVAELEECKRDNGGPAQGCPDHDYFGGACWDVRESQKAGDKKNFNEAWSKCYDKGLDLGCGGAGRQEELACEIARNVCGTPGSVTPLSACAQCIKDNFRGIPTWNEKYRWGMMCTAGMCSGSWQHWKEDVIDCCGGPLPSGRGIQMAYSQSFGDNSMVALSEIYELRHVRLVMIIPIIK